MSDTETMRWVDVEGSDGHLDMIDQPTGNQLYVSPMGAHAGITECLRQRFRQVATPFSDTFMAHNLSWIRKSV